MSFMVPRPDISGYYHLLKGEDKKNLDLKLDLNSEANINYKNEDQLLPVKQNPLQYNDSIIFPDKVQMNLEYYHAKSF